MEKEYYSVIIDDEVLIYEVKHSFTSIICSYTCPFIGRLL
jgi:hypothetical protein